MTLDASSCGICGFPLRGASCDACGEARGSGAAGEDVPRAQLLDGAQPEDYPGLKSAFLAWKQNDYPRMVGQCLAALLVEVPQVTNLPSGPGWSFVQDSVVIYLSLDRAAGEMAIESPLVKLVVTQRIPMMRALLELNDGSVGLARLCLRDDVVVLRFADRVENLSPPKLVAAIRDVAFRASGLDMALANSFGARTIGPDARRQHMAWSFLGIPRALQVFGRQPRSDAPPTASRPPRAPSSPPPAASWPARPVIATSPSAVASSASSSSSSSAPPPPLLDYPPPRVSASSLPAPSWPPRAFMGSAPPPPMAPAPSASTSPSQRPAPSTPPSASSVDVYAIAARGHDLLQPLLYVDRSAPGALLARGAVFLVQSETASQAPGSTSRFLSDALHHIPMFWQPPIERPGVDLTPDALNTLFETALREGRLGPTEMPVAIEPLRTAVDAKAHMRALSTELVKSPPDVAYRYYVLLGIFAELLVRAPLPPAMVERLRGLMAKARGLGETASSVNVLEDALRGVIG